MTSVVRVFDTLDFLCVVNTAPWVTLRLTYSRDQLRVYVQLFPSVKTLSETGAMLQSKGRTEEEGAFRSSSCQRVAHVVSESSQ